MSVIVTKSGFKPEDFFGQFERPEEAETRVALDLIAADDPADLQGKLDGTEIIRIAFGSFADGTGFSHAHHLRQMGFKGRLRAFGPLIADQLPMALAAGFDEVEIPDALAARQSEPDWLAALSRYADLSYQARLRQSA